MSRVYYVVETMDGETLSREVSTLKEARKELKRLKTEDEALGIADTFTYVVGKYKETDTEIHYLGEVK